MTTETLNKIHIQRLILLLQSQTRINQILNVQKVDQKCSFLALATCQV